MSILAVVCAGFLCQFLLVCLSGEWRVYPNNLCVYEEGLKWKCNVCHVCLSFVTQRVNRNIVTCLSCDSESLQGQHWETSHSFTVVMSRCTLTTIHCISTMTLATLYCYSKVIECILQYCSEICCLLYSIEKLVCVYLGTLSLNYGMNAIFLMRCSYYI